MRAPPPDRAGAACGAVADVRQNVAVAPSRSRAKVTSPESIKLLAYGKSGRRKAPQTQRLLDWYRQMYLIRRFEEAAAEMYALGKVGGESVDEA